MGKRRLARQYALQTLYFADLGKISLSDIGSYKEDFKDSLDGESFAFCSDLIEGTITNIAALDEVISKYAKNWSLARMSGVDRSLLRMSAYEIMLARPPAPIPAIIDEAIELAKKFSTENSSRFINGLLDQIKKERKHGQD